MFMLDTVPKGLKLNLREISQPKKIKKTKQKKNTKQQKPKNKQTNRSTFRAIGKI